MTDETLPKDGESLEDFQERRSKEADKDISKYKESMTREEWGKYGEEVTERIKSHQANAPKKRERTAWPAHVRIGSVDLPLDKTCPHCRKVYLGLLEGRLAGDALCGMVFTPSINAFGKVVFYHVHIVEPTDPHVGDTWKLCL